MSYIKTLIILGILQLGLLIPVLAQESDTTSQKFHLVDKMPAFGDCVKIKKEEKRQECTNRSLQEYIYKNMNYPDDAKNERLTGTVLISFIISKEGKVIETEVIKGVEGGISLDNEALRIINSMPDWEPGSYKGVTEKVKYIIPIRFQL